MRYLIQNDEMDIERKIILDTTSKGFDYLEISSKDIPEILKDDIPIGTIPFVTNILTKIDSSFEKEQPIEIPLYLQTDEFLKRDYKIGTWKDIPKSGYWFIKDASELKNFSICTDMSYFYNEDLFDYKLKTKYDATLSLSKSHDYVISKIFNIKSEYRIYVIDGIIENIALYMGDPTWLPDINMIKKAVQLINKNEKWLKSYSLDIMVGPNGSAIIEIHNFTSLGLYSTIWNNNTLRYGYRQGIDYLLNDNSIKYKEV